MPHTLPIVPAWHPAINSAKNFPFSFTSQLFCVFVCRRTKEHRRGVDISHSHPETCCFSALVTPTLILMMMWTTVWIPAHLLPMCDSDRPPWPLTSQSVLRHFQYIFLSLLSRLHHSTGVWLILSDSGDFNINHLFSLVWCTVFGSQTNVWSATECGEKISCTPWRLSLSPSLRL